MKRLGYEIEGFLPHLLMVFSLMMLTFYVITLFNEAMGFFTARISMWFQVAYLALAIVVAADSILPKRMRIYAAIVGGCCMAMLIPVVIGTLNNDVAFFSGKLYQNLAGLLSVGTCEYAIHTFIRQRKEAQTDMAVSEPVSESAEQVQHV